MEIPKKVRISGIDYEIEFIEEIKDDIHETKYRGIVLIKEDKIKILSSYSSGEQFRTLLHEIIHVIDDDYRLELEESIIIRLATSLYQVLNDNNMLR